MGSVEKRVTDLEAKTPDALWETPIGVLVLLKAVARHHARERGEQPPAYSQEELAHMHSEDLVEAAGGGVVGKFRNCAGWTSPEAMELLAAWEEDARQRLARVEAGEPLAAVYDDAGEELEAAYTDEDEELQDE